MARRKEMAKYKDIKGALKFIRQGYSNGEPPFRFTVADLMNELDISEKKARDVLGVINTRADFWRGNFPVGGENFIVGSSVFDRITGWFD
jgi:hypothetical protein